MLLFLLLATGGGCGPIGPGYTDYSQHLSGKYFVHRTSSHQVFVAPERWSDDTPRIPAKIVELAWDDNYIVAKQQHLHRRSPNDPHDAYEEPAPGNFSYWILRVNEPKAWGPMTQEEFATRREQLGVNKDLSLSILEE
jgi:hypothetical protein